MKATGRRHSAFMNALAISVFVSLGAPVAAQDTAASPASQRTELTESILAAKERALGESFAPSIRASLKSRMEALSMEQLNSLAQQGDTADLPSLLGSITSDLVYTPVTPCRVFDSRPSQGGPGPIPANTQRNVFVAGTLGFEAQGGLAGGCGVPVGATSAIINFVTVLPAGPGNIRAWAVADPQPPAPLAAIMNYGSVVGLPAIANGVAVPLCNPAATSCTLGDLRLQADTSATNILGDVVGYFGPAAGLVTSVNSITGPLTIAAGSNISVTPSGGTLTIANTAPVNLGTVTSVATGPGLTGGPITASGTLDIANGGVTTAKIADGGVTTAKIADASVTAAKIGAGQVVKGLNGLADTVTIAGSGGTTVSTAGGTITVGTAAAPSILTGFSGDTTLIGAGYTELMEIQESWKPMTMSGAPTGRYGHPAVWTGSKMIVWGGYGSVGGAFVGTGGQYDPVADSWTPTTMVGAPVPRGEHTGVWTGSRMIIWGGYADAYVFLDTGGEYDPINNSWTPTPTADAPEARVAHSAVWTGARMIVWGGLDATFAAIRTGGQYVPGSGWIVGGTTTTGAPTARLGQSAVWTGSKMVVWGGTNLTTVTNTGGLFDPSLGNGSWVAMTTTGAPSARKVHSTIWTGSRMIVWGGKDESIPTPTVFNSGGVYDPSVGPAGSWATATVAGAPSARDSHTAVWTGSRMIVWGGADPFSPALATGGQYNPASDSWTVLSMIGAPAPRAAPTAIWTGTRMVVWGGVDGSPFPLGTGAQWFKLSYFAKN